MQFKHIRRLEAELLVALDALLVENHVSRAAARAGITQPAMSRALARLREAIGDPLLVRTGRGMRPTPRATALAAPLHRLLVELDDAFAVREFDPSRTQRVFRVATADYGCAVLVPPLLGYLARHAPAVELVVTSVDGDYHEALEAGRIDLVVAPRRRGPAGMVWRPLFEDRFVTVARADHPELGKLTLARFCALDHVVVTTAGTSPSAIDAVLARVGRTRRIALRVPSFLAAPIAVAGSTAITTTPARIAELFAAPFGLALHAPPIAMPGLSISLGWHERVRADPAHAWLRAAVQRIGADLGRLGARALTSVGNH